MIVVLTLLFLLHLLLTALFWRRGQAVASFLSLLVAIFFGLWICATVASYYYFNNGPTSISEFEDKKERKEQEEKKTQEQKANQKNESEWVCTIVDDQKICTKNQENEAREDETSEWDCVTEGNRKICIKHGAEKWY